MFVNNQEQIIKQIERHASEDIPNESCGIVVKRQRGFEYIRSKNQAQNTIQSFLIDPALIAMEYKSIVYVVHSHVNKPPTPSERDILSCNRLKKPYLIISVPSNELFTIYPESAPSYKDGFIERDFFYGANDCFTLIKDYYKSEFLIELYDPVRLRYGWWCENSTEYENVTLQEALRHGFRVVESPKHGDVVIMKVNATSPSHWGIYLESGDILQNSIGAKGRIETYSGIWRRATTCFLRHYERD